MRVVHARRGTFEVDARTRVIRERSVCMPVDDPELVYAYRPDYDAPRGRSTNSAGMLQPDDVSIDRTPGVERIALVGDSLSAGIYLAPGARLAPQIERALAERGKSACEVFNFGVHGYGATQEARMIETRVLPYHPDTIVLQFCLNDPGWSFTPNAWFVDPVEPRVHLFEFVMRRLHVSVPEHERRSVPMVGPGRTPDGFWPRIFDADGDAWRDFVTAYERIDAAARTVDARVVLALFPLLLDGSYEPGVLAPYHAQVRAVGEQLGWPVVDLRAVFEREPLERVRFDPEDIYHPSAAGMRLAADELVAFL